MIFQYNNTPIFYQINGSGPVLVLLHGFYESSSIWQKLIPKLSKRYTILSLDFPGHGKSELASEIQSMELLADIVKQLCDFLSFKNVSLLGHSMGGYVALAFIDLYPKYVEKIILLNTTTKADSTERKKIRNRANNLLLTEKDSLISMAINNLFSENNRSVFKKEIEQLKLEASTFPEKGIIALNTGMRDRKDRAQILRDFPKEKYILAGKDDPLVSYNSIKTISSNTNTPLKTLHGSHMSWLENREEIIKFLLLID